jgi:ferredoxin
MIRNEETVALMTDGDWVLRRSSIKESYTYYSHYITHACEQITERYKAAGSSWPRQRYFYHDDKHWMCDLCHKVCPEGLQALLVLRMMDSPPHPPDMRWTAGAWNTYPVTTAKTSQNTPK